MNNESKQSSRPALGKGLASLLPSAQSNAALAKQAMGGLPPPPPALPALGSEAVLGDRVPGITMIDPERIVTNQFQPRRDFNEQGLQELAESIKANGVIQPLIVRRGEDGRLHLIAGERRLRASKLAGLRQVPVVIRKSSDKEALEIALVENIQREDLNCVDVALSYFQLMEDFRLTQEEVAQRVGKDRASVANHLRLLKLPEGLIQDLRAEKLSFGHGRALLAVSDPVKRMELRNKIVEKQLSVREAERIVGEWIAATTGHSERPGRKAKAATPEMAAFGERLGRALGTKVKTKGDQYRGTIVIEYYSKEDMERIGDQLLR
jgi:ParB family transcriptional regulator, chromosome partitioning protein